MHRYAVFGSPIAHSQSPRIHAAFARQAGIAMQYEAIESPIEGFAGALDAFAANGGRGANITLPLKEAAFALCAGTSARAQRAGAVNTLLRTGAGWHGDNAFRRADASAPFFRHAQQMTQPVQRNVNEGGRDDRIAHGRRELDGQDKGGRIQSPVRLPPPPAAIG